jgi:hypothetical protein
LGFDAEAFDRRMPLPPDWKISHIRKAIPRSCYAKAGRPLPTAKRKPVYREVASPVRRVETYAKTERKTTTERDELF